MSDDPSCSIERSLQVLGERWSLLILRQIFIGQHRFAEIQAELGVAPNLLSARLKTLVEAGVLRMRPYQEAGSRQRQSYHLTDAGRDLLPILGAFQQWGDRYRPRPSGPSVARRTRTTGEPLHVAFVTEDGREVDLSDVDMLVTRDAA
ncbi:winged helix-turn-helix transcriptional regulator [Kutzneria kofuensis]|uniref:DNA-binding HxlR family transcriptional regulator n=1 Tax=Kutzneria kofuensis TaxID=103725 RepID=A0A7W9NJU6_9PSEU|nr:helix-turn-helix domain-containing protein [Kutzneria kofuensis]MBB5896002.1 DNA-binding HxlR family transcriptional regulator [Kutzneria kofuensis]